MVDARLPDGSRVNAIIPPLAVAGPTLTIRKFRKDPFQMQDLIKFGTLTPKAGQFLEACVRGKLNVLISGGTGSGKTTHAERAVGGDPGRRAHHHRRGRGRAPAPPGARDHARDAPANIEGKGQVTIRDLVRNTLRMRPDRIIVGECPWRRDGRHAPGHEHGPRRVAHDHPREHARATPFAASRRWC